MAFVSSSLTLAGSEQAVTDALAALRSGGTRFLSSSGIGREMNLIQPGATAWMLLDVQRSARLQDSPNDRAGNRYDDTIKPMVRKLSTVAFWAQSTDAGIDFSGTALTADEETRGLLEDMLRGMTAAWRMASQEKNPEWVSVIRGITIEQSDRGVTVSGSIPAALIQEKVADVAAKR